MIGASLIRRLIADQFEIHLLLRPGTDRTRLNGLEDQLQIHYGDITSANEVEQVVRVAKPSTVFHLASTPFNPPVAAEVHLQVNVLGTANLLTSVQNFPNTVLVFTGSAAVYGMGSRLSEAEVMQPETLLGASKGCASMLLQTYARLYSTRTVELRVFGAYGPWEHSRRLVPHVIYSALDNQDVQMTLGTQKRDFVYVDDVVEALLLAAETPVPPGSVFNIGSGIGTPVKEAALLILKLMGEPVNLKLGAVTARPDEIMEMSANIDAAGSSLAWKPKTTLKEGLDRSIAWFQENRKIVKQYS